MALHKTDLARVTLQSQGAGLSQHERRILILCDGRRDLTTLVQMLGGDCLPTVHLLIQQGYLLDAKREYADAVRASQRVPITPRGLLDRLRGIAPTGGAASAVMTISKPDALVKPAASITASEAVAHTPSAPAVQAAAPASASPATGGVRRSIAASKMYMIDMLQLQRTMEASALAADIQASADEDALVGSLLVALRYLFERAPGMGARIGERLGNSIPEQHLPRVQCELVLLQMQLLPQENSVHPNNVVKLREREVA